MLKNGKKILIVDDDPDIGMMLKVMLEFKSFTAVVVERAEKVLETLTADNIDLIIMDMLLSGVNGTDVCRDLKKNTATKQIPILMISAHPNAKEVCLQAGAEDFVAKPFDMQEILSKINVLINRYQA
jgi:DNA-binding response OmpR family regulator